MPKLTIAPEFDPPTRTRTYRVTVAWGSGSCTRHGFATHDAAVDAGRRMLADVPVEEPTGRLVAVAGAGRLTGR